MTTYKHGDYNAICDRCGFEYKASKLKKEWTGLMVCKDCYEPRHPQDYLRARSEDSSVPWTRPDTSGEASSGTNLNGDSITTSLVVETHGDIDYTTTTADDFVHVFSSALTANRYISVITDASYSNEDRTIIYRTGGGAYELEVRSDATAIYTIPANVNGVVTLRYYNSAWIFDNFYIIGL